MKTTALVATDVLGGLEKMGIFIPSGNENWEFSHYLFIFGCWSIIVFSPVLHTVNFISHISLTALQKC